MQDKLLLRAARGEKTQQTPIWFMRQAGRYLPEYRAVRKTSDTLTMFKTPKIASEITLQPIKRFPKLDGAILYADILLIPDAFGLGLHFVEGEGPHFQKTIRTHTDLAALLPQAENVKKVIEQLSFVRHTVEDVKKNLPPAVTFLGFAGAPLTVASYMIEGRSSKDFLETKKLIYREPKVFCDLMRLITQSTIAYLEMQIEAGVEVIQLFESWSGALPAEDYRTFCLPYVQEIIAHIQKKVPVIYFLGQGAALLDDALQTKPNVLSIDWRQDLQSVSDKLTKLNAKVGLQGNLDPHALYAPQDVLKKKVERCLQIGQSYQGSYIFNLGHGITPETPLENVELMIQTVNQFK